MESIVEMFVPSSSIGSRSRANARATRVKLIVHDGWGVWCPARRLNAGHFVWPRGLESSTPLALTQEQFDALIVGLPWQRLHERRVITRV